jgi:hypothetical protein
MPPDEVACNDSVCASFGWLEVGLSAETLTPVSPLVAFAFEVTEDGPRIHVELPGGLGAVPVV